MESDADSFRSLWLAALESEPDSYRQDLADEVDTPLVGWRDRLVRSAEDPDEGVFIGTIDDVAAGVMIVTADHDDESMSIDGMWVDPAYRRRGLGHAMVVAATEWGCNRSARTARLAVNVSDAAAERLFMECEFLPTGETEPLRQGSGETVTWMERTLIG